jgi:folate-binding protein YgfZ
VASIPRLVIFLAIATKILTHQNLPTRPERPRKVAHGAHSGTFGGVAGRVPTIDRVEAAATVELDGQYRALREEAGFLVRERGMAHVRGPDAIEYLQGQLTNDLEGLATGQGCYAALLDRKGHIQGDLRVLILHEDDVFLDFEPAAAAAVMRHLTMYSVGRDLEVADAAGEWVIASVIGPRALQATGFEGLGPEHAQSFRSWEGVDVLGVATDGGVDLIARASDREALSRLLEGAGLPEVSEEATEIIRVESGRPRFGREMTTATMPQEAGINERAVSFEKGCYIGQETVARLHYRGKPNRHLRGLRLDAPAANGDPIVAGEKEVGRVGTAVLSPALGPVALAVVRREAEPGARVAVGEQNSAEIVELPF